MSDLTDFYSGDGKTKPEGFSFVDILAASNEEWEDSHSFIQWVFPLKEASLYNPNAPLLTEEDIVEFSSNKEIRKNVETMFIRALDFFFPQDLEEIIKPAWVTEIDHNHLRITRVINSLKLMGFKTLSITFFNRVMKVVDMYPDAINSNTLDFWHQAKNS